MHKHFSTLLENVKKKLFRQNRGNLFTALCEYLRLNCFLKGSMSKQILKKIKKIQELQEIGDLGVMRGRGRKWILMKLQKKWLFPLLKESPAPSILRQALEG